MEATGSSEAMVFIYQGTLCHFPEERNPQVWHNISEDRSIYLLLHSPFCWTLATFSFLILYIVGRTPWRGDQTVARPVPTKRTTQTQNKRTQTSMSWVGFELTIPAFERAKTVHALYRVATMIGFQQNYYKLKIAWINECCKTTKETKQVKKFLTSLTTRWWEWCQGRNCVFPVGSVNSFATTLIHLERKNISGADILLIYKLRITLRWKYSRNLHNLVHR
jgi:hypothetical protein